MLEKYNAVFIETFGISEEQLGNLQYRSIDAWDSVGHMGLITALENTFDIKIESDDIICFNSFYKGKEILKKYGVEF